MACYLEVDMILSSHRHNVLEIQAPLLTAWLWPVLPILRLTGAILESVDCDWLYIWCGITRGHCMTEISYCLRVHKMSDLTNEAIEFENWVLKLFIGGVGALAGCKCSIASGMLRMYKRYNLSAYAAYCFIAHA